jgi:ABC-type uncharacterized transport system substrate-binding protein
MNRLQENKSASYFAGIVFFVALFMPAAPVLAHPHVFVEANLEIMRNENGAVYEMRHVWRFDALFSSTVLLDFDANGDGQLDSAELDTVSTMVTESIGENNFFTEIRMGMNRIDFTGPEKILVDLIDGQILMFFAEIFEDPVEINNRVFRVSVSDPTYYVAMEIGGEAAVQITGNGADCNVKIERPDFDRLLATNQSTLTEQFFNDPENATLGDEWMTWINLACS